MIASEKSDAPTVTSTANVTATTNVTATFSEAMDASTIDATTVEAIGPARQRSSAKGQRGAKRQPVG